MVANKLPSEEQLKEPLSLHGTYLGPPVMEVQYPIMIGEKHLANAHVAYFLDIPHTLKRDTWFKLAGVLLGSLVPLLVIAYLVVRWITRPVQELTQAVAAMSPEAPCPITIEATRRSDEIGELARAFNSLTVRLADSHQRLRSANIDLESRVMERTELLSSANQRLLDSEHRLTAILDNIADGIITVEPNGCIESFNRAANIIFGYAPEEIIGSHISILIPEMKQEAQSDDFPRLIQQNRMAVTHNQPDELVGRRKSGDSFPMDIVWSVPQTGQSQLFIGVARDVTQLRATPDQLHYAANHDILTGLYNRGYFHEELVRATMRAQRDIHQSLALLFIDLDHFKQLNDALGHAAGDRLLIDVGGLLCRRVRNSDLVARLGGDEFVVLLYDVTSEQAKTLAEAFRIRLEKYVRENTLTAGGVSCSIGITIINKNNANLAEVLAQADAACYEAKHAGRNTVCMFNPENGNKGLPLASTQR